MKHSERILSKISDKECRRISTKVIRSLIKRSGKSPEDYAVLNNLWDEICVQVQDEHSFMWDAYEDTIFSMLMTEVKKLEGHIAQAIWFQTGDGIDWLVENENSPSACYDESSIANHIMKEYVLTAADDWSNERIRKYLDGYWE